MPVIANSSLIILSFSSGKNLCTLALYHKKKKQTHGFRTPSRSSIDHVNREGENNFSLHFICIEREREREGERRWCRRIRIRIGWRWRRRREAQTTWKCIRRGKYRFSRIPIFSASPLLLALVDSSSATIQVLTPLSLPLFPLICLRALKFLIAFF